MMHQLVTTLFLCLLSGLVMADSPLGLWTAIDEKTGKKRALVKFYESKNKIMGQLIKIYRVPGDPVNCQKCPGKFKNRPIKGLNFIWGLVRSGRNSWSGGYILDSYKGKIYRFKMKLRGNKLFVRGYMGTPLLGRSQTWVRK